MDDGDLIELANQVGERYASLPCTEDALAGIVDYLGDVWPVAWRARLLAFVRSHPDGCVSGACLEPTVLAAVHRLSGSGTPPEAA